MSDSGTDRAIFTFDAEASYRLVRELRDAGVMPSRGLRYVAAVTGPWKIFKVMSYGAPEELVDVAARLDAPGDPETAISLRSAQVRRSDYRAFTALVRIHTSVPDPSTLLHQIREVIGGEEADVVVGAFDILACVVDDDETSLGDKILSLRRIDGVQRTVSLRVLDYVSTSPNAPEGHRVRPAD